MRAVRLLMLGGCAVSVTACAAAVATTAVRLLMLAVCAVSVTAVTTVVRLLMLGGCTVHCSCGDYCGATVDDARRLCCECHCNDTTAVRLLMLGGCAVSVAALQLWRLLWCDY